MGNLRSEKSMRVGDKLYKQWLRTRNLIFSVNVKNIVTK